MVALSRLEPTGHPSHACAMRRRIPLFNTDDEREGLRKRIEGILQKYKERGELKFEETDNTNGVRRRIIQMPFKTELAAAM